MNTSLFCLGFFLFFSNFSVISSVITANTDHWNLWAGTASFMQGPELDFLDSKIKPSG